MAKVGVVLSGCGVYDGAEILRMANQEDCRDHSVILSLSKDASTIAINEAGLTSPSEF